MFGWLFGWSWTTWIIFIIIIIIAVWIIISRFKEFASKLTDGYWNNKDPLDKTSRYVDTQYSNYNELHYDELHYNNNYQVRVPYSDRSHSGREYSDENYQVRVPYSDRSHSGRECADGNNNNYYLFNETGYMEDYNMTTDDLLAHTQLVMRSSPENENCNSNSYDHNEVLSDEDDNQSIITEENQDLINRLRYIKNNNSMDSKSQNKESIGEFISRRVLENLYDLNFPSSRPDFLRNPRTGHNLELDGYCLELGIAFEYQGEQHYHYPNDFHKTENEFLEQVARDKYKLKACELADVYLIRIPYHVNHQDIRQYIIDRLPQYD